MPPITLAFVVEASKKMPKTLLAFKRYVDRNISDGFILDGIQRLNALNRARQSSPGDFPGAQSLFLNIIICPSVDNLLYRMITLNNGQRPMTARHQVEILASNAFAFEDSGVTLSTEKEKRRGRPGIFKRADFELAYMAFLSGSIAIDSQKLIQEKLDELLANKILENSPQGGSLEFYQVVELISKFVSSPKLDKWFKINNNLIGFAAGIRGGYSAIHEMESDEFQVLVDSLEDAFRKFDVSKIKLGRARRLAVNYVISKVETLDYSDPDDIAERLTSIID